MVARAGSARKVLRRALLLIRRSSVRFRVGDSAINPVPALGSLRYARGDQGGAADRAGAELTVRVRTPAIGDTTGRDPAREAREARPREAIARTHRGDPEAAEGPQRRGAARPHSRPSSTRRRSS